MNKQSQWDVTVGLLPVGKDEHRGETKTSGKSLWLFKEIGAPSATNSRKFPKAGESLASNLKGQ